MTLKVNFNNPNILRGHLEQTLPALGIGLDEERRVFVGKDGGLAYRLFRAGDNYVPRREIALDTKVDMAAIRNYLNCVDVYLHTATEMAEGYGFKPMSYNGMDELCLEITANTSVFTSVIGDTEIKSAQRFEKFLRMIKEGTPRLKEMYDNVIDSAGKIRRA